MANPADVVLSGGSVLMLNRKFRRFMTSRDPFGIKAKRSEARAKRGLKGFSPTSPGILAQGSKSLNSLGHFLQGYDLTWTKATASDYIIINLCNVTSLLEAWYSSNERVKPHYDKSEIKLHIKTSDIPFQGYLLVWMLPDGVNPFSGSSVVSFSASSTSSIRSQLIAVTDSDMKFTILNEFEGRPFYTNASRLFSCDFHWDIKDILNGFNNKINESEFFGDTNPNLFVVALIDPIDNTTSSGTLKGFRQDAYHFNPR